MPNAETASLMLSLYASTPRFLRQPDLDERVGERTAVHACCWDELGGGMVYFADGVDPNVNEDAERLQIEPYDFFWPSPY